MVETTYSSSHQQRVKEISSVLHDGEQTTYLSRIWYNGTYHPLGLMVSVC